MGMHAVPPSFTLTTTQDDPPFTHMIMEPTDAQQPHDGPPSPNSTHTTYDNNGIVVCSRPAAAATATARTSPSCAARSPSRPAMWCVRAWVLRL
jgi:hypothetical protein